MARPPFTPASPHGEITELFPDVFFVTGGVKMAPLLSISRNMTIVREGERLVIIGSMRLNDAGLAELDKLGTVTDVIRLAGFHGMDDPFYQHRYDAKVWALEGSPYRRGFNPNDTSKPEYFEPDVRIKEQTELPLAGASLYTFSTKPPEALLLLEREGGIVVAGDCLQNWRVIDPYFSFVGKLMMKTMGFIRPHNLGPGWIKGVKPAPAEIKGILDLPFEHVLPAHGEPVKSDAKSKYRPVIDGYAAG